MNNALRHLVWIALAALSLGGCSQDKHTFLSTVDLPTTVSLIDPYSHQALWTNAIPVGHKLVIDLDRGDENELMSTEPRLAATKVTWTLTDLATDEESEPREQALPGTPILMRVTYRKAPEYPPASVGSGAATRPGGKPLNCCPVPRAARRESVSLIDGP